MKKVSGLYTNRRKFHFTVCYHKSYWQITVYDENNQHLGNDFYDTKKEVIDYLSREDATKI